MKKIHDLMVKFFNNIMFVSSGLVCVLIVIGAFMRYVLKKDFYGSEEIILLIAFWMYFIGSAFATYEGSQISADLLTSSLKTEKKKIMLKIIQEIISFFLFALLTWWTFKFNKFSFEIGQKTQVYKIPMIASLSSILFSFILSTIYTAINIGRNINNFRGLRRVKS